jgi:hypothetical protein
MKAIMNPTLLRVSGMNDTKTKSENMNALFQSPYVQWFEHTPRDVREKNIDIYEIPQGNYNYSELNRYIHRVDNLFSTQAPGGKIKFSNICSSSHGQWRLYFMVSFGQGNTWESFCRDVEADFFTNFSVHQATLITIFQGILADAENTLNHHLFIHDYDKLVQFKHSLKEDNGQVSIHPLLVPFENLKKTSIAITQLFKVIEFFIPLAHLDIYYNQNPVDQHYSINLRLTKEIEGSGSNLVAVSGLVPVRIFNRTEFIDNPVEIDWAIPFAIARLIEKLEALPEYQKVKEKIDLYHKLSHDLKPLELEHGNNNNKDMGNNYNTHSPTLKI